MVLNLLVGGVKNWKRTSRSPASGFTGKETRSGCKLAQVHSLWPSRDPQPVFLTLCPLHFTLVRMSALNGVD